MSRSGSVKKFEFLRPFSKTTEKNMFCIELKTKFVDNAQQSFAFTSQANFPAHTEGEGDGIESRLSS